MVGLVRFFEQVYQAIVQHIDFEIVKVLIIASPGFYKDSLYKYIVEEALRTQFKPIIENRFATTSSQKVKDLARPFFIRPQTLPQ